MIGAGTWTYGALLMTISGLGTVQEFPANAANGLGSPTPPVSAGPIPTLGDWAMIGLVAALACLGAVAARRRTS